MDFLRDYWTYNSCYEIHRNYAIFSALSLIGATINRRLYYLHGDVEIHGNTYTVLVGPQGNHKTTPCDFARDIFKIVNPEYAIGASTQSAEDIVLNMSKPDFARKYINEYGDPTEVNAYAFFINEFKNFIAYSPVRMLNFLGDIYDRKFFDSSTIKRGAEGIVNPCLNILACENPDQLSTLMKNNIITGGMARRMILVNETTYKEPIPFPVISDEARLCINFQTKSGRVIERLKETRKLVGQFKWTPEGQALYAPWYIDNNRRLADTMSPIMRGYMSSKHIQLFKICMQIDAVSDKPMLMFSKDLLEEGIATLEVLDRNMPKLSVAAGKNEYMAGYAKVIELLEGNGGWMSEKILKKHLEIDMDGFEIFNAIKHMEDTDDIIKKLCSVPNGEGKRVDRWMIMLPKKFKEISLTQFP